MANGGVINEPVFGVGARSRGSYAFGEKGPEAVLPLGRSATGGPVRLHPDDLRALAQVLASRPAVLQLDGREIDRYVEQSHAALADSLVYG